MRIPKPPATPPLTFRPSTSGVARGAKGQPAAIGALSRQSRGLFKGLNHTNVRNARSHVSKLQNS